MRIKKGRLAFILSTNCEPLSLLPLCRLRTLPRMVQGVNRHHAPATYKLYQINSKKSSKSEKYRIG